MTERIGPYQLLTRLGTGGMGEVFLARLEREQGFAKHLALKRILPALSGSRRFQELFAAEARLTAGLNHPNIVQVVDFGSQADTCYLVMEHVDGADLAALLEAAARAGRRVPLEVAVGIGLACARALSHAHGLPHPVIHGDVCPANVLVGRAGELKLTDFGLARLATEPGRQAAGHPGAMAPEVASGAPPDARSDQFGLGATLLQLASGQPAYPPAADPDQALELARRGRVRRAAELQPDIHPGLAAIIDRALALNPADRHPGIEALEDALERLRHGLGLATGPRPIARMAADLLGAGDRMPPGLARGSTLVAGQERAGRGGRARRSRVLLLALGGTVLAGGLMAAWWWAAGPGSAPAAVPPPAAGEPAAVNLEPSVPAPPPDLAAFLEAGDAPPAARLPTPDPTVGPAPSPEPDHAARPEPGFGPGAPTTPEPAAPAAPEGAWIQVPDAGGWTMDGRSVRAQRQVLAPGDHLIGLSSESGLSVRMRVEVPGRPGPASLSVQSEPYAILRLDGRPRGTTPIAGLVLSSGDHRLDLVAEGGRRARLELKLHVP